MLPVLLARSVQQDRQAVVHANVLQILTLEPTINVLPVLLARPVQQDRQALVHANVLQILT